MNRIVLAFRCFFSLLFSGELSQSTLVAMDLSRRGAAPAPKSAPAAAAPAPAPAARTSDGALQLLAILQRDSRLVDFLMEDIAGYSDDQVGAAVRELHDQCRDTLSRYVKLEPVIDGVEGTYAKSPGKDPALVKFVGNVPAQPPPAAPSATKAGAPPKWTCPRSAPKPTPPSSLPRKLKLSKKTPQAAYVIGIDLGTTNSALAFAERRDDPDPFAPANVQLLPVPQLTNPGEVRDETLLPSFLYLPGASDFPSGSTALPWDGERGWVVGRLAQKRGVENAGRLVSSAKSWLSHSGVDRTSALLPFRAPEGVDKISPVLASRRYLEHLREAWDAAHPDAPFTSQHVLVTVPASFDAVARELTLEAAQQAGYRDITLLEEPQAAFYAWIERHPDWRERVQVGDLILVVDIGGGTTDFTLIAVTEQNGELALNRVAVGDHILLGGDNIDLALAGVVAQRLAAKGTRIDARQHQQLWANCRAAKEKLLEPGNTAADHPVTILGKGSGLVGGTIKASLERADIERVLTEGFLPEVSSSDMPAHQRRVGVQELGLPYAADAAITRHLARFLRQQASGAEHGTVRRSPGGLAAPTHVLFNGGVLNAPLVRGRILGTLDSWLAAEGLPPVKPLEGEDLMHAVSRGAAYYGLARDGRGVRIRGGVPRTYYIGVESAMPSIPGFPAPLKALTVVPFGMEEGTETRIPGREFGLVIGQPAEFRFFTSAARKNDQPGDLIEDFGDELAELSPMEVAFEAGETSEVVPVSFQSVVTETGVLQLWAVARDGRKWKLEFNVREKVT